MSKFVRLFFVPVILFSLLAASGGVAYAQQEGTSKYFSETGHTVSGEFWKYYQSVPDAGLVFGYPITDAFPDAKSGRVIQYFTRARFELFPEKPEGQRVLLSPLGSYIYSPGQGLNAFAPVGCRYFTSGFSICYAFLEFFDKYGGEAVFGQPLSGFESLDGRIVQYFERARFGWYPEYGEGQKVALAELGRMHFDLAKEDKNLLKPVTYNGIVDVLTLQTRVFARKSVIQPNDRQFIYVVVQDQTLSPVYNAAAIVNIYWPNGSPQSVSLTTDRNGVVIASFPVTGQSPGSLVTVQVQVLYQGMEGHAVTSFRVWR